MKVKVIELSNKKVKHGVNMTPLIIKKTFYEVQLCNDDF